MAKNKFLKVGASAMLVASAIVPAIVVEVDVANAQSSTEVNFVDSNLRAAVAKELGKSDGDVITQDDLTKLYKLSAANANISDLTGLEYATNLNQIYLSNNEIHDLSPLKNLDLTSFGGLLVAIVLDNNKIDFRIKSNYDIYQNWSSSCSTCMGFVLSATNQNPDTGTVTINYVDENGSLLEIESRENIPLTNYDLSPKSVTGYSLNDSATKTAALTQNTKTADITFSMKGNEGSLTVSYVDDKGQKIADDKKIGIKGIHTENSADFLEYELVGEPTQTVTVDSIGKESELTFVYKKVVGSATFNYVDEKGKIIKTEKLNNLVAGTHTASALEFDAYDLIGDKNKSFTINKNNLNPTISFPYAAVTGNLTVKYLNSNGVELDSKIVKNLAVGEHTEYAKSIDGYKLISSPSKSYTISKGNLTPTVTFTYEKTVEEKPQAATGTINVRYIDEDGLELDSKVINNVMVGSYTEYAKAITGYTLVGNNKQSVTISATNLTPTITFTYKKNEEVKKGAVTVNYVNENGAVLDSKLVSDVAYGTHTETAKSITGYTLVGTNKQSVIVSATNLTPTITFTYKSAVQDVKGTVTVNYYDDKGVLINTKTLNNVNAGTHTEFAPSISGYNLIGSASKSVLITESNKNHIITFTYKKSESELGTVTVKSIDENGIELDSKVINDLPLGKHTIDSATYEGYTLVGSKSNTVTISSNSLNHTIVFVYKKVAAETPAIIEQHENGNYKWFVDMKKAKDEKIIKNDTIELATDDITLTIPINEFSSAEKLNVEWKAIGLNEYELIITVDGERKKSFKNNVKIVKSHGFSYLLRGNNGEYEATPYTYKNNQFMTETKNLAKTFYFSTMLVTFSDITGLYSEKAIERLASRHIVFGTGNGKFSPKSNLTRAQFSAMISRALDLEPSSTNLSFTDINKIWAKDDIQALYELGIVKGYQNKFSPNNTITRGQAILMLHRLLSVYIENVPSAKPTFKDTHLFENNKPLYEAAGSLQALGIFVGSDGYLNPNQKLTRMQMAKVLELALEYIGKY